MALEFLSNLFRWMTARLRRKKSAADDPYFSTYFDRLEQFIARAASLKVRALHLATEYGVLVVVRGEDDRPAEDADVRHGEFGNPERVVIYTQEDGMAVDLSPLFHAIAIRDEGFRAEYEQLKLMREEIRLCERAWRKAFGKSLGNALIIDLPGV